jgi:tetratricopeptide (TPR) repeat protein
MSPIFSILLVLAASAEQPAEKAWQAGQKALEADRIEEAIGQFQLCLRLDPNYSQAHLSLAAAHLAVSRERTAEMHIRAYLKAHPDHFLIRWHLAELLFRRERHKDAAFEFHRYLTAAQLRDDISIELLVRCHTRLMETSMALNDEYGERLNRGIGLYLLARRRAEMGDAESRQAAEELLCKSAAELTLARMERPDEARPVWYLHRVWSGLSQSQPACRCLRLAVRQALPGTLTPAERREMALAIDEQRYVGLGK